MSDYQDNRRPEEIESDIERTRADVSSTIDAIQNKLTPGQLMDQAFGYARTSLPADFGANLGNAVRDNPVPVALIGIGLAWLAVSGRNADGRARQRRQKAEIQRESHFYASDTERAYEDAYGMEAAAGGRSSESEDAMHRAASKASETGRNLKDKASDLGHRISDKASALTGRAREMAGGAREKVSEGTGSTRARLGQVAQQSRQQYDRARNSVGHMVEEQPLMLGALGLALGTVLGALLPGTRREDELMGSTRDSLMDTAKRTAREQAGTVKESAQRVAKAAEQEVERVGSEVSRARHNTAAETSVADSFPQGGSGQKFPH